MTTVTIPMPEAMARDLSQAADILKMPSNEACAFEGVRISLQSILGKRRGRPYVHKSRPTTKPRQPKGRGKK